MEHLSEGDEEEPVYQLIRIYYLLNSTMLRRNLDARLQLKYNLMSFSLLVGIVEAGMALDMPWISRLVLSLLSSIFDLVTLLH